MQSTSAASHIQAYVSQMSCKFLTEIEMKF